MSRPSRPKVLFVSAQQPWPARGGTANRLQSVIRNLALDYDVDLFAPAPGVTMEDAPAGLSFAPWPTHPLRPELAWHKAIRWPLFFSRWLMQRDLPIQSQYFQDPSKVLAELTLQTQYELVWVFQLELAALVRSAIPGIPMVVDCDDNPLELIRQTLASTESIPHRAYLRSQERRYKSLMKNLTTSGCVLCFARLEKAPAGAMRVRNTIDDPGFVPVSERSPKARTVAFLGGLDFLPNREAVLFAATEILPSLRSEDPDVEFVVIGECDRELGSQLSLLDARVLGFVEDVGTALHGVSAMLVPLRTGSGSSIKTIDALARGVPIIANSFGVRGLDLAADVHYLPADEPDDYLSAWSKLRTNYPLAAEALSRAGREHYETHLSMSAQKRDIEAAIFAADTSLVR